jgi:farnesyl diphosphate synthase
VSPARELEELLDFARARIDKALDACLPAASEAPARLHEAMRYAVFSGGKRLRPALAYAAARACGAEPSVADPVAIAVELVHSYSLVHDDLPAMDDDDERRGRPTVHVRFGEATAILAGDALQAEAFAALAAAGAPSDTILAFARAAGSRALVGGQANDLEFERAGATLATVASVHERKTAALFAFAAWGAGRLAGAPDASLGLLESFGRHYGQGFQLLDDLDDSDAQECSALAVASPQAVRAEAARHAALALEAAAPFGAKSASLRALARALSARLP